MLDCDGSEVVVRFPPFTATKLEENAEATFADDKSRGRKPPRYGVSVMADQCENGESIEDVVSRICLETSVGRRSKTIAVTTGTTLRKSGFEVVSDPTEKEPRHHLVGTDPFSAMPNGEELESLLIERMPNPAWTKGAA